MHWNSLRSLLRTYERSTCSKSIVSISHYPTRGKKRRTRVVGVQQTNSGGEGRRRKGEVVSFPGPSLPSTSMCLLVLPHVLVQFLRSPRSLAFWLSVHLMLTLEKPSAWLSATRNTSLMLENRAEKKTLLAGYAEATYDCTFSILQSVNFKFTIHMLTVVKRVNFEIVVNCGKCVSRK